MKLTARAIILCIFALLTGCTGTSSNLCCVSNTGETELQGSTVKIMTLNVAHGRRQNVNQLFVSKEKTYKNLNLIAGLLRKVDADAVALQEADGRSRWSGGFNHVEYLSDKTGWPNYVHGLHADGWLYSYGTAILSRHKMADSSIHNFDASFPTTTKGFVAAKFNWLRGDTLTPLTVISIHLDFSRKSVREKQITELTIFLEQINGPFILSGDFNSKWSAKDSALRDLVERLKLQVYEPSEAGMGTYKSTDNGRLDWIILSPELEFVNYETRPETVSDHLAVVAEIGHR